MTVSRTKPCLSQTVWASYANCRLWSPFTNNPLSGAVMLRVTVRRFSFFRRANFFLEVLSLRFLLLALALICVSSANTALGGKVSCLRHFLQNRRKDTVYRLFGKAMTEIIAHRGEMRCFLLQGVPQKPAVCYI